MNTSLLRAVLLAGALTCVALFNASAQTASQLYSEGVQTYQAGNAEAAKQKLRLALEIDKNFRPASLLLAKITAEEKQSGTQSTVVSVKSLEKVIVPVDFNGMTFTTAVEVLRQHISERTGGKLEVNFVFKLPPDLANKKVTLHLDHAPATEVMRYMGSLAGVEFKVEQYAVLIVPAGPTPSAASSQQAAAPTP